MEIGVRSLSEDLKEGFEEILAYRKGKTALRSERIEIPEPPKELRLHKKKKILSMFV